jgi:hypothetical protein
LAQFTDIEGTKWYASPIGYLVSQGILIGKSESIFDPENSITRAEFAMILAKAAGADLSKYTAKEFLDTNPGQWFAPAVAWAKETGVVSGYAKADGTLLFRPEANITRQDMAVMIHRYMEKIPSGSSTAVEVTGNAIGFVDEARIAVYASKAVTAMQQVGIISGVANSDGTRSFLPQQTATRAEAAVMVYRLLRNNNSL